MWNEFYSSRTDADLDRQFSSDRSDLELGKLDRKFISAVLNSAVASAATLTIAEANWGTTAVDTDEYNDGYIVIQNDDGKGVIFDVTDTVNSTGDAVFTVNLLDSYFGVDESSNFTSAATYTIHLASAKRYLGYTFEKVIEQNLTENSVISGNTRELKPRFKWISQSEPVINCELDNQPTSLFKDLMRFEQYGSASDVYYRPIKDDVNEYLVFVSGIKRVDNSELTFIFPRCTISLPSAALEIARGGDFTASDIEISILADSIATTDMFMDER